MRAAPPKLARLPGSRGLNTVAGSGSVTVAAGDWVRLFYYGGDGVVNGNGTPFNVFNDGEIYGVEFGVRKTNGQPLNDSRETLATVQIGAAWTSSPVYSLLAGTRVSTVPTIYPPYASTYTPGSTGADVAPFIGTYIGPAVLSGAPYQFGTPRRSFDWNPRFPFSAFFTGVGEYAPIPMKTNCTIDDAAPSMYFTAGCYTIDVNFGAGLPSPGDLWFDITVYILGRDVGSSFYTYNSTGGGGA